MNEEKPTVSQNRVLSLPSMTQVPSWLPFREWGGCKQCRCKLSSKVYISLSLAKRETKEWIWEVVMILVHRLILGQLLPVERRGPLGAY